MQSPRAPLLPTTPRLYLWIALVSLLLAAVPTAWPELDLSLASLFTGPVPRVDSNTWWWVEWINWYVPSAFRAMLLLAVAAWLIATLSKRWKAWRLPLAFVVVAGVVGPGAVVNLVFKDQWQRARPYQVQNFGGTQVFSRAAVMTDQCDANCSFVSGHVACGFFFTTLLLVHRRRAKVWATVGTIAGLTIGFARMSDVAHWFSDVLWAYPVTLGSSWLVWKFLCWCYRPPSPAPQ